MEHFHSVVLNSSVYLAHVLRSQLTTNCHARNLELENTDLFLVLTNTGVGSRLFGIPEADKPASRDGDIRLCGQKNLQLNGVRQNHLLDSISHHRPAKKGELSNNQ